MQLKPGTRLFSQTCDTQAMVVRAPATDLDVRCGGVPMATSAPTERVPAIAGDGGGSQMGKRYVDESDSVELLCTKAGESAISIADSVLVLKETKALPSSD
jgi:hypothetical protein